MRLPAARNKEISSSNALDDETIRVDRYATDLQAMVAEHLEREEVGRLLDDHDIAGFGQHRAQHVERLRVAVRREQLLGGNRDAVGLGEELAERDTMMTVTPLGAVLQELGRIGELHRRSAAHVVDGQDRVVRLPDTEVDHALGDDHLLKLNRRHGSNVGP